MVYIVGLDLERHIHQYLCPPNNESGLNHDKNRINHMKTCKEIY